MTGSVLRQERFLAVSLISLLFIHLAGEPFFDDHASLAPMAAIFLWLFLVVLGSAMAVVRHADHLAARLGEPYGTLIITLSVTAIEAMSITAVMLHGANNPTLVRDTLFSMVMMVLNGMVGLTLFIGAWRHREQQYNLQGANAYIGVIIPLSVLSLILPNYTSAVGRTLLIEQIFLVAASLVLYAVFVAMQTSRHRGYFVLEGENREELRAEAAIPSGRSLRHHGALLLLYLVPVVFLARELAHPIDYFVETRHWPEALAGLVMALLVATPEAVGAVRAANANDVQHSVNIFLGAILATIGLTIPVMLTVSHLTGRGVILGLPGPDVVMLLLTLFISAVTFSSGRTNVLQGAVHMTLFAAYFLLIFQA